MIKVNNLSKSYGEIKAVQNISFRVKEGDYAFLGKTARAKHHHQHLCAILKKDKGDVFIGATNLTPKTKIKKILGVVFQGSFGQGR